MADAVLSGGPPTAEIGLVPGARGPNSTAEDSVRREVCRRLCNVLIWGPKYHSNSGIAYSGS